MDVPGQWLAHVWVIRGQCHISAGAAPHCLDWSRPVWGAGWGVSDPAPWWRLSLVIRHIIMVSDHLRCGLIQGQELVTEHSTVSCVVSFSFEDKNTSGTVPSVLCVADDGDAVFIIPLSVYFYSHSPHCYWLQLVIMVVSSPLPTPAQIMSHCQEKLAMPPHLGISNWQSELTCASQEGIIICEQL